MRFLCFDICNLSIVKQVFQQYFLWKWLFGMMYGFGIGISELYWGIVMFVCVSCGYSQLMCWCSVWFGGGVMLFVGGGVKCWLMNVFSEKFGCDFCC